ncbi:hypothetical protein ACP70R_018174 [Stipagrostis hirtigluma subsp. patula]
MELILPEREDNSAKGHNWEDYMRNGIVFMHTFDSSNEIMLVLPSYLVGENPEQEQGRVVLVVRNGYCKYIGWNKYNHNAFLVVGWSDVWRLYNLSPGCRAVISIIEGVVMQMSLYEASGSGKVQSLIPIVDHCDSCSDDHYLTMLYRESETTTRLIKTVDPRTLEWRPRRTGYRRIRPPACSRDDFIRGTETLDDSKFIMSPNLRLLPVQKAMLLAIGLVQKTPPPVLVTRITDTKCCSSMKIPKKYVTDYLPRRRKMLYIQQQWTGEEVQVVYRVGKDGRGMITNGWHSFTRNLNDNDVIALRFGLYLRDDVFQAVAYLL